MKETLTLELTSTQYQQLVESLFVGGIRLDEGRWSLSKSGNNRLMKAILCQAAKFVKEDMIFKPPFGSDLQVSKETEEELIPYLFDYCKCHLKIRYILWHVLLHSFKLVFFPTDE